MLFFLFFFFNDTATTEIYTLSLHDALPISFCEPPGSVPPSLHAHAGSGVFRRSPGQPLASREFQVHRTAMFQRTNTVEKVDAEVFAAIQAENLRQQEHIELIASENYCSPAVMEAQGSQLTNKYAEGYPGKRYYGGCENVDVVEQLAIDRVKKLFGAQAANVQPNSGSQANQAVLMAFAKPGDTIMGDRKSTRLNSSHLVISYAVFCLKKKKMRNKLLTH